jgi:ribose transport system substrate-binding protein
LKKKCIVALAAAAVAILSSSACSSSSNGSNAGSTAGPASSSADSTSGSAGSGYAFATEAVSAAHKGLYVKPASGQKATSGKNVWFISCTQAAQGCAAPAASAQTAGKALGWKVTVFDGQATPSTESSGIREAIANHADGIILMAIDCAAVKSALQQAKAAKIPVVGLYSLDCNDPLSNAGPPLFTAETNSNGNDPSQLLELWGKLQADYAISKSAGQAQVIRVTEPDFLSIKHQVQGFDGELAKCSSCKIVSQVPIAAANLANPSAVSQQISTAMSQYPGANTIVMPSDTVLLEAAQALRVAKQKNPNLIVVGAEGLPAAIDLVREGVVSAEVILDSEWWAWEGLDVLNRIFANNGAVPAIPNQGLSFEILDKDHNLPAGGQQWAAPIDYEAAFKQSWGVS